MINNCHMYSTIYNKNQRKLRAKYRVKNYVIVLYNTNCVLCLGAKPSQAHNQPSQDHRPSPAGINTPAQPDSAQPESTPQPSQTLHPSPTGINTPAQPESTPQPS